MIQQGAVLASALAIPQSATTALLEQVGFRFSWGAFDLCLAPLAKGWSAPCVTQKYGTITAMRQRRYTAARFRQCGHLAEPFWQVTASQYKQLHRAAGVKKYERSFRGLRVWPVSDPLAYLKGWRQRQEMAQQIDGSS